MYVLLEYSCQQVLGKRLCQESSRTVAVVLSRSQEVVLRHYMHDPQTSDTFLSSGSTVTDENGKAILPYYTVFKQYA